MGKFSDLCKGCGHPALSKAATTAGVNEWMNDIVVLMPNGDRVSGSYDGYGNAGGYDDVVGNGNNAVHHRACWIAAGKPEFDGPSDHADDQGWFFEPGAHDMAPPAPVPARS